MSALETFGEGARDALFTEIPGTEISLAYGLGAAAVVLGGIWIIQKGIRNTFK